MLKIQLMLCVVVFHFVPFTRLSVLDINQNLQTNVETKYYKLVVEIEYQDLYHAISYRLLLSDNSCLV